MIQPVSAFSPQAEFRGSNGAYGKVAKGHPNSVAYINAGGFSLAAGGLTAAIARGYTPNWGYAGILGLFGAFLALFFMTPQLIENSGKKSLKSKAATDTFVKTDSVKAANQIKTHLKPAKKLVPFRQTNS